MHDVATTRRQFLTGTAGMAAVGLMAGCGSSGSSAGSGGKTDSGVLNVWGGVPAASGPQTLINAFTKKSPDVKVNYTQFTNDPNGNLKLDTALQGGAGIDMFFTYTFANLTKRVTAGLALDLTARVKSDATLANLGQPDRSPLYAGKLYSLPTDREPYFVFINKDMAKAANVNIPAQWDVDQFHAAAKKLTTSQVHGAFSAPPVAVPTLGPNANYNTAGTKVNFDSSAWRADTQLAVGMQHDRSAYPEAQVLAQQLTAYSQNVFLTGKVGLWFTGAFSLRYINDTKQYPHSFTTTFAPEPAPTVGSTGFWNTGALNNLISIAKKSSNQDAAWTFTKFWLGEGAKYMLPAGKVSPPLVNDQTTVVDGLLGNDPNKLYDVDAFKRVYFDKSVRLGVPTIETAAPEIANIQTQLTQQALLGKISVNQWVAQMQSQCNAAIAKDR